MSRQVDNNGCYEGGIGDPETETIGQTAQTWGELDQEGIVMTICSTKKS